MSYNIRVQELRIWQFCQNIFRRKQMNKIIVALFTTFLFFFAGAASAQQNQTLPTTHTAYIGDTVSYEHISVRMTPDGVLHSLMCNNQTGCLRGIETSTYAEANFAGSKFLIQKGNLSGQKIYHSMLNNRVSWQLLQNGRPAGFVHITLKFENNKGERVYGEEIDLRSVGISGNAETVLQGSSLVYQTGFINGQKFSIAQGVR